MKLTSLSVFFITLLSWQVINGQDTISLNILKEVNKVRETGYRCEEKYMEPVPALTYSSLLSDVAKRQVIDMEGKKFFSHTGSDGSTVAVRAREAGYTWWKVGENIALGQKSSHEVIRDWLTSEGHCENIMNKDYKEMGVAYKSRYWVQVFGAKEKN